MRGVVRQVGPLEALPCRLGSIVTTALACPCGSPPLPQSNSTQHTYAHSAVRSR